MKIYVVFAIGLVKIVYWILENYNNAFNSQILGHFT